MTEAVYIWRTEGPSHLKWCQVPKLREKQQSDTNHFICKKQQDSSEVPWTGLNTNMQYLQVRGHYRTKCPRIQETPEQREDPVSPYEPESEPIQELESENESVISDTTTDTTIITTTSTWAKVQTSRPRLGYHRPRLTKSHRSSKRGGLPDKLEQGSRDPG